jgi:hypothetical protein
MSAEQGHSGGAEQRRFARVPINLDGLLSIGMQAPLPCTVRDFCVGGMFVTADPGAYAVVKPETPAILYFALMVNGEKHDYQVKLAIARAVAKGIGVSFADPEPETLALLGQLAAPGGMPTLPGTAAEVGLSQKGFATEYDVVEVPLKALIAEHVTKMCDEFLEQVDEQLFLGARDAGNNVDQNRMLDGQREMRARQKHVLEEVPAKIDFGVTILGNPLSDRDTDPALMSLSDLSLIEKDEFEEFLAVSEIVSELEPEFSDVLFQLDRRFSFLANREIGTSGLPIGPNVLCNAISDSLKGLQSDRKVIAQVYAILCSVMSDKLTDFYQAVNDFLVEKGVLPIIERDKSVPKRKPTAPGGFDAPLDRTGVQFAPQVEESFADLMPGPEHYQGHPGASQGRAQAFNPAPNSVQAAPPAYPTDAGAAPLPRDYGVRAVPPSYPAGAVQAAAPTLPAGAIQVAPPSYSDSGVQSAPPSYPVTGVQSASPTYPEAGVQAAHPITAGQRAANATHGWAAQTFGGWSSPPAQFSVPTVQRAYSTAQAQLALRRELLPSSNVEMSETMRQRGAYSTSQVVDGLTQLQHEFAGRDTAELLSATSIKERIIASLLDDGTPQRVVGDDAVDAIDVVANLFNALLQDAVVAKNAKSQLSRLQPAVHRAALVDPEFFEASDHPVRQVINRVARLRDGKGDGQQERNAAVGQLVSRLNQDFGDDVGVFDDVVSELDEVLAAQENEHGDKVAAVVQSCEQQEQILSARRGQSLEDTDSSIDRSDLPEEWNKWLDRSRKVAVGQRVLLNATSSRAATVTLVWKEPRNNLFVFVDDEGNKASTLTLQ